MSAHLQGSAPCWLALVAFLTATQPVTSQTWIQWTLASGGNNHYYAVTSFPTNWAAAQKLAVSWGGTLATITSSNEQNFINDTFLTGPFEHLPLWIGLRDPSAGGALTAWWRKVAERFGIHHMVKFQWVTSEPLSFTNWKPGEPNNQSPGEYNVAINWEYSDNPPRGLKGDWNDTPLNGTSGFGGKTDGPYFGLVERETDPTQPIPRALAMPLLSVPPVAVLVIVLVLGFARFRRRRQSANTPPLDPSPQS